ncbi:Thioredoxin-like protein [Corchorus olitorius]|uniref:glutathione transferase n=1 Tax=Corchorus olitorius TaxID=93759 RepID=A0A1R3I9F1_9ROSI|nr:Thioredoxin-like protein [Corchorus olitorius]
MGEENKVVLHGMWASPYNKRVELALKLKGIPFEYVEEDLQNKSPQLLQYNPVYKRTPVLVHYAKPISESRIILEYIDETWKNSPSLLPEDPCKRAKVRFRTTYIEQQLVDPERNPLIFSWLAAIKQLPLVKESIPPLYKFVRENALKSSSA